MRLACRLLNGDDINFEYAIVELTPDYAAYLLRLVDEAERLKKSHETFCEIEFMDYQAEYGSSLGGLEKNLPEFGEGRKWIKVPDDFEWPKDSQQSLAASTVVITKGTIVWQALGSHDYDGPYFETNELPVEELRRLFPQRTMEQDVKTGREFCPKCHSDQIEGDSVDFDGPHCTQRMRCLECHADWTDVYVLSDIQD